MFHSMIINDSDTNFEKSINDINIEYEKSYSAFKKKYFDLDLEDNEILKTSLLFKNWSSNTLRLFIEDNRVLLKKFKYKDSIAKEIDCNQNIYILKSGDAKCYIRISRSQIKKHQKTLESNATSPFFIEPSIDRQKSKCLRENLLKSQSNEHSLKSKYLDYKREKTFHSLSQSTERFKNQSKRVTFNHFHPSQTQSNSKPRTAINHQNFNYNSSSIMIKPMSAIPDPKIKANKDAFRSSSTNMVRMNKSIKHFTQKQNQLNDNFNNPIEIVSSHNIMEDSGSDQYGKSDFFNETNSCNKIKTRLPEIWNEIYRFNNTYSCFIKLMDLKPGQIFGLSDFLFDEKRQKENLDLSNSNYLENQEEIEANDSIMTESNKYHLIVDSKFAECYIIDKESYLKYMLSFTTDKTIINKYLDQMRDSCIKLPSVKAVNENFFQDLTWKLYKKRTYNELIDLSLKKSCK